MFKLKLGKFKFENNKYNQKILLLILTVILVILPLIIFNVYYFNRVYPGISVAGIYISGFTKDQVVNSLSEQIHYPAKITLLAKDKSFDVTLSELDFYYDFSETANSAQSVYRSGNYLNNFYSKIVSPLNSTNLQLVTHINEKKLDEYLQVITSETSIEPRYPSVSYKNGQISVDKGLAGEEPDVVTLKQKINEQLSYADFSPIYIYFKSINPTITDSDADNLRKRAESLVGKNIVLINEYQSFVLDDTTLLSFLAIQNGLKESEIEQEIADKIIPSVNRDSQNAVFRFESGKVVEFTPAKDGLSVNSQKLKVNISEGILKLESGNDKSITIEIPVEKSKPKITTEQVNNLGIKELLGRGTSRFKGSIPGRVHNISLASSKFNGVLVAPEQTFSFNSTLGDVSAFTGYKQAYIIKDGRTVLGDGGGVCQVSTTLFRATLNAGLPIIERRSHSYRVSYYEQDSSVGLDATVFDPTTDFKFKNDTPGHILIQTIFDAKNLTLSFEIYGTSDGRVVTITKPVITSSTPPPEDLYVDDPSLPTGTIKQIDYKAWGAKVVFDYKVERKEEVVYEKTFVSNYRPWQAVFLRGTGSALPN